MIQLSDLFSMELFHNMIAEKYVRYQVHPFLPYRVLNYTEKATFAREWNPVTTQCRGLIYNTETGEIIARPFPKFFNYGEHDPGTFNLDHPVLVTDKYDGSLGITYSNTFIVSVATRGSFESDQAIHATEVLSERYTEWAPPMGWTYLFEIVYPANRIVLNYGETDDLILLGAVSINTGKSIGPIEAKCNGLWEGPIAKVFEHVNLEEALAQTPRPNKEGIVVHLKDTETRIKLKQDDYVRLHRIVTGMNLRMLWTLLGEGKTEAGIASNVPEEFWPWIHEKCEEIFKRYAELSFPAQAEYDRIKGMIGENALRKDFAEMAKKYDHPGLLFALYDGRDTRPLIWKMIKPDAEQPMVQEVQ